MSGPEQANNVPLRGDEERMMEKGIRKRIKISVLIGDYGKQLQIQQTKPIGMHLQVRQSMIDCEKIVLFKIIA